MDHTKTRLYYTLISDSLQTVFVKDVVHIGTASINTSLKIYDDGTSISTFPEDTEYVQRWLLGERLSYIFTFDVCQFPIFECLKVPQNITRTLTTPNAGGSSEISEAISMYYMYLKFGAYSFIPEMEVKYCSQSCICDYVMEIGHHRVGVSVTRAIGYPTNKVISIERARYLLYKKLHGLIIAKRTVSTENQFDMSVIHLWCQSWLDAFVIRDAYVSIIDNDIYGLYGHIYVICTVCPNEFIYTNIIGP